MMMDAPATKQDLVDLFMEIDQLFDRKLNDAVDNRIIPMVHQIVGDTVSEVVGDAMQVIAERMDNLEHKLDQDRPDRSIFGKCF